MRGLLGYLQLTLTVSSLRYSPFVTRSSFLALPPPLSIPQYLKVLLHAAMQSHMVTKLSDQILELHTEMNNQDQKLAHFEGMKRQNARLASELAGKSKKLEELTEETREFRNEQKILGGMGRGSKSVNSSPGGSTNDLPAMGGGNPGNGGGGDGMRSSGDGGRRRASSGDGSDFFRRIGRGAIKEKIVEGVQAAKKALSESQGNRKSQGNRRRTFSGEGEGGRRRRSSGWRTGGIDLNEMEVDFTTEL